MTLINFVCQNDFFCSYRYSVKNIYPCKGQSQKQLPPLKNQSAGDRELLGKFSFESSEEREILSRIQYIFPIQYILYISNIYSKATSVFKGFKGMMTVLYLVYLLCKTSIYLNGYRTFLLKSHTIHNSNSLFISHNHRRIQNIIQGSRQKRAQACVNTSSGLTSFLGPSLLVLSL